MTTVVLGVAVIFLSSINATKRTRNKNQKIKREYMVYTISEKVSDHFKYSLTHILAVLIMVGRKRIESREQETRA